MAANNEFEPIANKLRDFNAEPAAGDWDAIAKRLNKPTSRRWIVWPLLMAAGLACGYGIWEWKTGKQEGMREVAKMETAQNKTSTKSPQTNTTPVENNPMTGLAEEQIVPTPGNNVDAHTNTGNVSAPGNKVLVEENAQQEKLSSRKKNLKEGVQDNESVAKTQKKTGTSVLKISEASAIMPEGDNLVAGTKASNIASSAKQPVSDLKLENKTLFSGKSSLLTPKDSLNVLLSNADTFSNLAKVEIENNQLTNSIQRPMTEPAENVFDTISSSAKTGFKKQKTWMVYTGVGQSKGINSLSLNSSKAMLEDLAGGGLSTSYSTTILSTQSQWQTAFSAGASRAIQLKPKLAVNFGLGYNYLQHKQNVGYRIDSSLQGGVVNSGILKNYTRMHLLNISADLQLGVFRTEAQQFGFSVGLGAQYMVGARSFSKSQSDTTNQLSTSRETKLKSDTSIFRFQPVASAGLFWKHNIGKRQGQLQPLLTYTLRQFGKNNDLHILQWQLRYLFQINR